MSFSISSTAFNEGERIPEQYTCEGVDISPPLSWSDPPERPHLCRDRDTARNSQGEVEQGAEHGEIPSDRSSVVGLTTDRNR